MMKTFGGLLLESFVITFLAGMLVTFLNDVSVTERLETFLEFCLLVGFCNFMILISCLYRIYLNLLLSFGCTRKHFFVSVQVFKVLCIAAALFLGFLSGIPGHAAGQAVGERLLMIAAGMIASGGMGEIFGALQLKFSSKGAVAIVAVSAVLGSFVVLTSRNYSGFWQLFFSGNVLWLLIQLLMIALILYFTGIFAAWCIVMRYEVRE